MRESGPSDYDILVILPDEAECDSLARQEINQACAGAKLSATARFIYHEIDYVNRKLEIGQYFFSDIVAEGKMLYDADVFTLAEEKALTPDEHYLGLLGAHAARIDNAFRTVFSSDDEFEREAFTALEYAYIGDLADLAGHPLKITRNLDGGLSSSGFMLFVIQQDRATDT